MLFRTYPTGFAPVSCTIWKVARATSVAPTFFSFIKFGSQEGGDFIDVGINCNNLIKIIVKKAKSYYGMKKYKARQSTCFVSIGTGQKDLIQLYKAAFMFWFKDRSGLFIAPALDKIVIDCENTHDEVLFTYLENNVQNIYYRFNVVQGMQQIVLDEWAKKNDIKTYTDKYLRFNQTERELLDCVDRLLIFSQIVSEAEDFRDTDEREHPNSQRLRITQAGSTFQGSNLVHGGTQLQGNFIGSEQLFSSRH